MKNDILVHLNGVAHSIRGEDAFLTLSDFLRGKLRLVGTKIMCSEGDCGACTVLVGRPSLKNNGSESTPSINWFYQSVDSCIQFMFQLDAAHVVTIEGLSKVTRQADELTAIQNSFIDHQGSQCGFCTPGFVMSLAGMREATDKPDIETIREGLSGNLCRCTGYVAIEEAAKDPSFAQHKTIQELYCHRSIEETIASRSSHESLVKWDEGDEERVIYIPKELSQGLKFLHDHPKATVIAGASDVGVWHCKFGFQLKNVLCINQIEELKQVYSPNKKFEGVAHDHSIIIGSSSNWEGVRAACKEDIPQFERLLSLFGSPQIRHVGTIGGNVINGSPIADSLPILFAMDASLRLASQNGLRWVPIHDFYTGYKKNVMQPGELLTHIEIPIPKPNEILKLYKVSRRRDMDISTFTAAIALELLDGVVSNARIALGGVGPQVIRASKAEKLLKGNVWCERLAREAGEIAATEVSPISDVRGSEKIQTHAYEKCFPSILF